MSEAVLSTYFWRELAERRYAEIRQKQAEKLIPLRDMLAARNYEGIEGSLITADQIANPDTDSEIYRAKRLNYVLLLDQLQCQSVMEIGFNWGYSGSLILESSPLCHLHSVDIAMHWYTPPSGEIMQSIYPGRFRYTWKDSKQALLDEIKAGNTYDAISVDGGHDTVTATSDILLSLKLLRNGGLLIVDDTDALSVSAAVLATIADHPSMVELTAKNSGIFEFGSSTLPCFEQRYFLKRHPIDLEHRAEKRRPLFRKNNAKTND